MIPPSPAPAKPRRIPKPFQETEAGVQRAIVEGLEALSYRVLQTSRHMKRCKHCGKFPGRPDGVDRGLPDLVVTRDDWPTLEFCGIEVKGPETDLSPEQKALRARGRIAVARSFDDAMAIVIAYAAARGYPAPAPAEARWHDREWIRRVARGDP